MDKKVYLYYIIVFTVGIFIAIYFFFWGFRLNFSGVGPCTYNSFTFFCILYGTLGAILAFSSNKKQNIIASILISMPMIVLFYFAMFSDVSLEEQIPRFLGLICPLISALAGVTGGNIIRDRLL
ncbi:MAG: hypothetical protein B1H08_06145 [Candidatus Omnitrophica bacterium 4484_171]|nr:MAG: hypothetical protein B1H08_06145 [Candidatus Omnitrophica bacterium 4484_171]